MRTSLIAGAGLVALAHAAAVNNNDAMRAEIIKRQSVTSGVGDADILQFALTLEHLEDAFYKQALARFTDADFNTAGFRGAYANIQTIAADEAQHVSFLTTALSAAGATPVSACNYTFPYSDVKGFLGLAQVIEGVGVSAYLGAASDIETPGYVTAAASILTVEARHNAFLRYIQGYSFVPTPEDTPQSAKAVVTMAGGFFASCPNGSEPSIAPFPTLTLTSANVTLGSTVMLAPTNASAVSLSGTVYCGFASGLGAGFSTYANGGCPVPTANVTDGQTYVVLTRSQSLSDASVLAGPAIVEIGLPSATGTSGSTSGTGSSGAAAGGSTSGTMMGAATGRAAASVAGLAGLVAAAVFLL